MADQIAETVEITTEDPFKTLDRGKFVSVSASELQNVLQKHPDLKVSDEEKKDGAIFFGKLNNDKIQNDTPPQLQVGQYRPQPDHFDILAQNLGISRDEAKAIKIEDAGLLRKGQDNKTIYLFGFIENDSRKEPSHDETLKKLNEKYKEYSFSSLEN